ncbi:DUF4064 domain-containing protein [Pseudogracilibacillus auburnensis]|uniref:Uncharacterized protein DUF4064 n=1 Tax=Pseudogracilibacillus auburnensis TaxID=1494959 RepID=A0A2V3W7D0_9BACI|nr:DUF4064 domain-containing protein [Pseudogracilibacillus auburnensis]MBO1001582.1 DUF4064 domain-containing protein [Pseudogracilibacillus auburnensis]PXW89496.1 uncharacterized protein DUF4064 [Pseudogracilibacillus auburnensis]
MKRTGEIVMTVIGLILNVLGAIGFLLLASFLNTDYFRLGFEEGFNDSLAEDGLEGAFEAGSFLNVIAGFGWFMFFLCLIGVVAGIVALIFFKGNKKPKAAGIILILTSIVILLGTLGTGFFQFILYLIAGIMGLVRKPPLVDEDMDDETVIDVK